MAGQNSTPILQPTGLEEDRPFVQIVIEILILGTLCCISVIGNTLVCVVIYRSRRVQSITNYFVATCAVADIVLVLVMFPFVSGRIFMSKWIFGDFMCRFIRFVQLLFPSITLYILTSIAIDRYYTIIYPLSFRVTKGVAKRMIVMSCIISCFFSSFGVYFYHEVVVWTGGNSSKSVCQTYVDPRDQVGAVMTIVSVVLQYVSPCILISIIYVRLFKFIWRSSGQCFLFQRTTNHVPRTKVKMVKMLIVMTCMTMVLLFPVFYSVVWVALRVPEVMNATVAIMCLGLLIATTLAKPLIYTVYNSNFRRGCREVFCMSSARCYRSNTYAITTASAFSRKNHVGVMSTASDRNLDSPMKAFDRSVQVERDEWPIQNGMPTTYL